MFSLRRLAAGVLAAALVLPVAADVMVGPSTALEPTAVAASTTADPVITPINRASVAAQVTTVKMQPPHASQDAIASPQGTSKRTAERQVTARADIDSAVAVVGVTWARTATAPQMRYRLHTAKGWSEWDEVEAEDLDDQRGNAGTEPITVVGASQIEITASAVGNELPTDLNVAVWDPGTAPADAQLPQQAGPAQQQTRPNPAAHSRAASAQTNSTSEPVVTIYSRAAWGADEKLMTWPVKQGTYKGAAVHHTAGSNNYTAAQVPAILRGIYSYHAVTRGWGDIGYNVLVDQFGRAWQGRSGKLTEQPVGAHIAGANSQLFGISVMGNFEAAAPPAIAQDTVARVIAWKFRLHGINPSGSMTVTGGQRGRVTASTIVGHRDIGYTSCPGEAFYARLPHLRTKVKEYYDAAAPGPVMPLMRDIDGDGADDLFIGQKYFSRALIGSNNAGLSPTTILASAALPPTARLVATNDFDSDGRLDVLMVAPDGRLYLVQANPKAGATSSVIGVGWSAYTIVSANLDWDGDGKVDIIARHDPTGKLYLYQTNGAGRFTNTRQIGQGWGSMRLMMLTPRGHTTSLLAADNAGIMWAYDSNGRGGFTGARRQVGVGWNSISAIAPAGDIDGDGHIDLIGSTGRNTFRGYTLRNGVFTGTRELPFSGAQQQVLPASKASVASLAWLRGSDHQLRLAQLAREQHPQLGNLPIAGENIRDVVGIGDVTGSGTADILVRDNDGGILLYRGADAQKFSAGERIGWGWGGFSSLTLIQQGPNGNPAVAGVVDGQVRIYTTNGKGSFTGGWKTLGVADARSVLPLPLTRSTGLDRVGVITSDHRLHRFSLSSSLSKGAVVGVGWPTNNTATGGLDFNGDGKIDVMLLQDTGDLRLYTTRTDGRYDFTGVVARNLPYETIR